MPMPSRVTCSDVFHRPGAFTPDPGSVYISAYSAVEERSNHVQQWSRRAADVTFVSISDSGSRYEATATLDGRETSILLRSQRSLDEFWARFETKLLYLDITGMRHHIWAALVDSIWRQCDRLRVVYVEPGGYRASLTPTENEIYDLSEAIDGISPLPRFSRLRESGDQWCFIPLLGFEGARTLHLINQLEPPSDKIIPVVGIPGFRAEYPFVAFHSNRGALLQGRAWQNVRFATANCPFDMFRTLQDIRRAFAGHILKIGLIGTKPHALGAVLFGITNPNDVELVYDHPIRKASRTAGVGRLLVYHVSAVQHQP